MPCRRRACPFAEVQVLAEQEVKYYGTLARARFLEAVCNALAIRHWAAGQAKATQSSDRVEPERLLAATWHIAHPSGPLGSH